MCRCHLIVSDVNAGNFPKISHFSGKCPAIFLENFQENFRVFISSHIFDTFFILITSLTITLVCTRAVTKMMEDSKRLTVTMTLAIVVYNTQCHMTPHSDSIETVYTVY